MTDETDTPEPEQPRGLYSGFERYATPTDADFRAVLTSGLVVLDSSALLNLYRYTPRVRTTLLDLLNEVGDTLWEPDQVMLEFWRRRESAISDYDTAAQSFEKSVTAAKNATTEAIGALGNRIGLDAEHKNSWLRPIEEAYANLSESVRQTMNHDGATAPNRDTSADPVLAALDPLLRCRVGKALDPDAHQAALTEARRRVAAKEPPGYMDAKKPDGGVGDFLVWRQLLNEAVSRRSDALLVTGDVKEDWWRKWGGISTAGPRLELVDEFHAEVGLRFFMLQPGDFLIKAAEIFGVEVPAESVAQVRQVDAHQGASSWRSGFHYEEAAVQALIDAAGDSGMVEATIEYSGPHDGIDFELRSGDQVVAVIIRYMSRPTIGWGWVDKSIQQVLTAGYDRLLFISNQNIDERHRQRIQNLRMMAAFVQWSGPQDNDSLTQIIGHLFVDGESAEG